ncbi:putative cinnamyl alcohol dehydrogenase 6 [Zea mays]|uniref:cinnamyl-alcohol dehydrogenase n=1 Tax=Zea mays TaxID=4577 RepID=A0A1D6I3Z8_MAIZE|nr:putative cinnamyl alcohol dehydrogenase 6 [Zea mays]
MAGGKEAHGWAARDVSGHLSPYHFSRRVQRDDDVTIKVLFCGLCHTDLHVIKNEFGNAKYPVVPGHEIVGVVTDVGSGVTSFKPGDTVGVGYFVDSCRSCDSCSKGRDPEQMRAAAGTLDGVIDTVSADHPVVPLLDLLKPMGQMVVVGLPTKPLQVPAFSLVAGGKRVAGSAGGGVGECQAMLDFAGEHGITADVEVVGMDYVNTAIQRLERNDVRYRFVVDVAGSKIGG